MKKRSLKKVALTLAAALAASARQEAATRSPHQQRQGVPREQRVRPEKRAAAKRIR